MGNSNRAGEEEIQKDTNTHRKPAIIPIHTQDPYKRAQLYSRVYPCENEKCTGISVCDSMQEAIYIPYHSNMSV